jgi:hypothetical protein
MRLQELVLRIPGDEFRVRLHEHLTVLSGIGMLERQALGDSLIGALTGAADGTVLTYLDCTGRPVEVVSSGGTAACRYLDDGSAALPLVGTVAPTSDALRALMMLRAGDVGLSPARTRRDDNPELAEARATLSALTTQLQDLVNGHQRHEQLRDELAGINAQLRQAQDSTARRDYARVLADLERVRAEAAALQSGDAGAQSDDELVESAGEARHLATQWTAAADRLSRLVRDLPAARIEPAVLAQVRWYPDDVPGDLRRLLGDLAEARRERDHLETRRRELATSSLPEPSDPRVVDLASIDQSTLWNLKHDVVEAAHVLEHEQLAQGGLGADGGELDVVSKIEAAHTVVIDLEALVDRRRVPTIAGTAIAALASMMLAPAAPVAAMLLLAAAAVGTGIGLALPMRRLVRAKVREGHALKMVDANTYLAFHLRRVDAAIMPGAQSRLEATLASHRGAVVRWNELTGGLAMADAVRLEREVHEYAAALAQLGNAAGELETLRNELSERAEPAVARARAALVEACATYGLDDVTVETSDAAAIEELVLHQVALGRMARAQEELQDAEADEEKLSQRLEDVLRRLGLRDGTLEARVSALEWAVERAVERNEARARARSREQIEEELVHLQEEARRLRRPEWESVQASDADGPDIDELLTRKAEIQTELAIEPEVPADVERLADRHSAMERRVAALEAHVDGDRDETTISQLADVQQYLLAHLTKAAHAGPYDESVPVVLDEPFLRVASERKWELLDMLARLGEKTQLIYLTDDPFVSAWARRRATAGVITLLEPVEV